MVSASECFTSGQFFGIIFGSILGAFIICSGIGLALWYLHRKHEQAEKILVFERAHATQETNSSISTFGADHMEKGIVTEIVQVRERVSVRDKAVEVALPTPLPRRRPLPRVSSSSSSSRSHRSRSLEFLETTDEALRRRRDQELALSRFGFSIESGDQNSSYPGGIFVERVLPGTPAELSGNIFSGDRIKMLTISFDDMAFEDALAILSLVSDYTIRLDLERTSKNDEMTQTEEISEVRLPYPLKSFSTQYMQKKLECDSRHCESLEYLQAPALPKKKAEKHKIPDSYFSSEEERVVHIVRHPPRRRLPSAKSFTSEGSSLSAIPEGHRLIRASEFDKKIKESMEIQMNCMKANVVENFSATTSTVSVPGSIVVKQQPRAVVVSSEATVAISDSTKVEVESVHLPPRSPEVPLLEAVVVQAQQEISSISESPKASLPELMIDVGPSIQLAVTSPRRDAPSLTPDFIEVRAQKYSKQSEDGIVDRKLPSLPASALRTKEETKNNPAQLYLQARNNLKEVYTGSSEDKKNVLSTEQVHTLESNRKKLDREKQQLKEMGIL
ncbi:hypothetical protein FO519_002427 [Halicephalobus sp. NKZ332]|nr:hypothetical protein FO519_002427 [Halicephalobus sp. NKZ332]